MMEKTNRGMTRCLPAEDLAAGEELLHSIPTMESLIVAKLDHLFDLFRAECAKQDFELEFKKDKVVVKRRNIFYGRNEYNYETLAGMAMMGIQYDTEFTIKVLENPQGYIQPCVECADKAKRNVHETFAYVNAELEKYLKENPYEELYTVALAQSIFNHNRPDDPPYAELISVMKTGDQVSVPIWRDALFYCVAKENVSFERRGDERIGIIFSSEMIQSFYSPIREALSILSARFGEQDA